MLVLKLPLKLCVARVAARRDHEGGLEGPAGLSVVSRMAGALSRAGLPTPAEGVASVAVRCFPASTMRRSNFIWIFKLLKKPAHHPRWKDEHGACGNFYT